MGPDEVNAMRDRAQLLDVREQWEWDSGHIPGSTHVPMAELAARQDEIAQDRTVVCVCRSGNRSGMVVQALQRAGYEAENLDGGLQAWAASGHELTTPEGAPGQVA